MRSALAGVVAFGVVLGVSVVVGAPAQAADSSAVTVTARDQDPDAANAPFPDLELTVSQTRDLVSQAVTVSWKGAKPSTLPSGQTGGENYLQLMQCWGDDASGGPDRTTCQFGGANKPGATRTQTNIEVAPEDAPFSHVGTDFADPTFTGIPFRSVTGKVIAGVDQDGKVIKNVDLNNNEFFTQYTTNEVSWAGSGADGTGDITFEVQTTLASPGLGCGAVAEGASTPRPCWLVAVPRGEGNNVESGIAWEQWKHRLAVRLDFQQVGSRCAIGAAERQLAGSELVSDAVSSWQPVLCNSGDTAFTLLSTTESDSAAQANTIPDAPLALTSYAIDPSAGVADGLTYAPIGLTGIAITFAIDRKPLSSAPQEVRDRARRAFTEMKLTPRLVAKLLTSSYLDALPTDADRSHLGGGANPRNLLKDPEFLALNDPEWGEQAIVGAVADVMVPQGRSGALRALWTYVWADAEARDFLAGGADPYGMTVNPYASTDPAKNANQNGSALELPRDDAPKVDPAEAFAGTPQALNSVTWRPYTNDLASGAYYALRGDGLTIGGWDSINTPNKYTRAPRDLAGERSVIALTDLPASERYDTVTASLRNQAGQFVVPNADSVAAAAAAMTPSSVQPQVVAYDPASDQARGAQSAYPLAMPVYAATNHALSTPDVRAGYAAFIRYAATDGQTPGEGMGQLPDGYAPLPQGWRDQALTAANTIEYGPVAAPAAPAAPEAPAAAPAPAPAAGGGSAPQAAPAPAAPAPADPAASGAVAGALSSAATPEDPDIAGIQGAVPFAMIAGVLAAGLFPFVGRLRRRD